MFQIAFDIIIAVILLFLLPYILTFVMGAIGIGLMIGLAAAAFFGALYIVPEITGSIIPISVFIGAAFLATFVGFILHKSLAGIQNLGGVKNSVRYLRVSFRLTFTERQKLAKAKKIKTIYETATEIKSDKENLAIEKSERRKAEQQKKIEDISDE